MKEITENDYLIYLNPEFKIQYRRAVQRALMGDLDGLAEQHRLITLLTDRINAHLGDGMDKPDGIKKGVIF